MKKLITMIVGGFLAAISVLAETRTWIKTDEYEHLWNSSWSATSNWEGEVVPQAGDSVVFDKEPTGENERIAADVQIYTSFDLDSISGLACYDIVFNISTWLTVRDVSQFFGTFRTGAYASRGNAGFNGIQPGGLKVLATAEQPSIVNNYDDCFDSQINIPNAGTTAEVQNVVHSAAGMFTKVGAGTLSAKFTAGADQKTTVKEGETVVRENGTTVDLGQALVFANTSLGVKEGETAKVGLVAVNGLNLNKTGDGDLLVGAFQPRQIEGRYDVADKMNVSVAAGGFGAMAVQPLDATKVVTPPTVHLDASEASSLVMDETDPTLVKSWGVATGKFKEGEGRLPKLVPDALGGKPVVDFGTAYVAGGENDGTSGYMEFPMITYFQTGCLVCRRKSLTRPTPLLGGWYSWVHFFRGGSGEGELIPRNLWGGDAPHVVLADWRIDGKAVDMQCYCLTDTDFHLITFELGEPCNWQRFLCAAPDFNQFGGLEIAEVALYDKALASGERANLEGYLMGKWLGRKAPLATETLSVGKLAFAQKGELAVTAEKPLTVETLEGEGVLVKKGSSSLVIGEQSGVTGVDVQGGSLSFTVGGSSLDLLSKGWFHMDPSDPTTLMIDGDGRVTNVVDASGGPRTASRSKRSIEFGSVAGPTQVVSSTGLSVLDFGANYGWGSPGNGSCGFAISEESLNVHTVFVVVEALNKEYAPGILGHWSNAPLRAHDGYILKDPSSSAITAGLSTWMLDGEIIDPFATAWPDGLHVIAFTIPEKDLNGNVVGGVPVNLIAQDRDEHLTNAVGAMRYGEVLILEGGVSVSDLKVLSMYLKSKWLGSAKDTSVGFSKFAVAAGASCSVSGNLTIADNATLAIGQEKKASGTLNVAGTVTLGKNVAVTTPNGRGQIPLVKATAFEDLESLATWTLNGGRFRYTLDEATGTLYANCGAGMMILIR